MKREALLWAGLALATSLVATGALAGEPEHLPVPQYPDNSVMFVVEQGGQATPMYVFKDTDKGVYGNAGANFAIGFEIPVKGSMQYLNARDVVRIVAKRGKRIVELRDGTKHKIAPNELKVLKCFPDKGCYRSALVSIYRTRAVIDGLEAYDESSLRMPAPIEPRDYLESQHFDFSSLRNAHTITVLVDEEYAPYKQALEQKREAIRAAIYARNQASQQKHMEQLAAMKREQEARSEAERAKREAQEAEAAQMRKSIKLGDTTNCGAVFDVRLPMIGVQTSAGIQYIALKRLYGRSAPCRFVNGQYVAPNE